MHHFLITNGNQIINIVHRILHPGASPVCFFDLLASTVKPVYKGHPRDLQKVAFI